MSPEDFKLLEQKIEGFIARHEQVRHEKSELLSRITECDREHALLLERLQQYEQERNEMRKFLEKLMNRFEGLDLQ